MKNFTMQSVQLLIFVKCIFGLGSNCTTLLVQHIVNFRLVKQEQKGSGENSSVPTMLYSLTPALLID